jgi:hypothetical protein
VIFGFPLGDVSIKTEIPKAVPLDAGRQGQRGTYIKYLLAVEAGD